MDIEKAVLKCNVEQKSEQELAKKNGEQRSGKEYYILEILKILEVQNVEQNAYKTNNE